MPAPKQPNLVGAFFAEQIIRLVAELRFYLGGENYTSGRYKSTHSMLFALEEHLRALDLDGPSAGALWKRTRVWCPSSCSRSAGPRNGWRRW